MPLKVNATWSAHKPPCAECEPWYMGAMGMCSLPPEPHVLTFFIKYKLFIYHRGWVLSEACIRFNLYLCYTFNVHSVVTDVGTMSLEGSTLIYTHTQTLTHAYTHWHIHRDLHTHIHRDLHTHIDIHILAQPHTQTFTSTHSK